jgi:hypothetical protein
MLAAFCATLVCEKKVGSRVNASLILFGKIAGLARHRRSNFSRRHDVIGESSDRVWRDA